MSSPEIQPLTPELLDSASALQPPGWGTIRDALELYLSASFCRSVCLAEGGRVKALGNLSVFQGTGWISHLIVSPEHRGQGLGRRILEHLLKRAGEEGVETLSLIATPDGEPLYRKLGFRDFARYAMMEAPAGPDRSEAPMDAARRDNSGDLPLPAGVRRFVPEDVPALAALDLQASGERRGRLITRFLENALVYGEEGDIRGFFLPDLREGPVLAGTPEAGQALLEVKARSCRELKLPEENSAGRKYLEDRGWKFVRWSRRMILGADLSWEPDLLWARIGGNFG